MPGRWLCHMTFSKSITVAYESRNRATTIAKFFLVYQQTSKTVNGSATYGLRTDRRPKNVISFENECFTENQYTIVQQRN